MKTPEPNEPIATGADATTAGATGATGATGAASDAAANTSADAKDGKKSSTLKLSIKDDAYLDLYRIYRSYVMEESGLINSRLTWIITINGLLYASFGIALQREVDAVRAADAEGALSGLLVDIATYTGLFLIIISAVGFLIGIIGWVSILAAQTASHAVVKIFNSDVIVAHEVLLNDKLKTIGYSTANGHILPSIRGGGSRTSVVLAHAASQAIPIILAISWAISLISVLFIWKGHQEIFPDFKLWTIK